MPLVSSLTCKLSCVFAKWAYNGKHSSVTPWLKRVRGGPKWMLSGCHFCTLDKHFCAGCSVNTLRYFVLQMVAALKSQTLSAASRNNTDSSDGRREAESRGFMEQSRPSTVKRKPLQVSCRSVLGLSRHLLS